MLSTYKFSSSLDQHAEVPTKVKFSVWHTFKHHIPRFVTTILIDIVLPLIIYFSLQKHIKIMYALLAASSPPLLMVIFKAIWFCTFDALSFLVFIGFMVSGVVAFITRSPIILLLEKSLATGIIGIIFTITLIPFHCCHDRFHLRPLAYYLYQDLVPINREAVGLPDSIFNDEQEQIDNQYTQFREEAWPKRLSKKQEVDKVSEWIYTNCSSFRCSCFIITGIWSVGFLLEFLARLFLIVIQLPVNKIVLYGHIILSSITILCIVSTIICITIERKYTLLLIKQWNMKQKHTKPLELDASFVTVNCNLDSVLNVDT